MTRCVLVVMGTRPEAIKLAPVVHALRQRGEDIRTVVVVTAQHREMLDQVLAPFGLQPDHDLDLMLHGQQPSDVLARALTGLSDIILREAPDALVVQGDTTSSLAGALAAFHAHVPVGHVEAGLRSGDLSRPFPEEMNRRVIAHLARWHFAPTAQAELNLLSEGIAPESISLTGNTIVDAMQMVTDMDCDGDDDLTGQVLASGRRVVLVTLHRRESWSSGIEQVCHALSDLVARFDDVQVVVPVHPNPAVSETVHRVLGHAPAIALVPPLGYVPFVKLMKASTLILTDSGGVQEEASSLGIPTLVLREVTERPEVIDAGVARLVGTSRARIAEQASLLLSDLRHYELMAGPRQLFGDGRAATRIADVLVRQVPSPETHEG